MSEAFAAVLLGVASALDAQIDAEVIFKSVRRLTLSLLIVPACIASYYLRHCAETRHPQMMRRRKVEWPRSHGRISLLVHRGGGA